MKVYYADLRDSTTGKLHRLLYLADEATLAEWVAAGVAYGQVGELAVDPVLMAQLHAALNFQVSMLRGEKVH